MSLALATALVSCGGGSSGEDARGDAVGSVLDDADPVSGVKVTLEGDAGSFESTTTTAGAFRVAGLPPGDYRVRFRGKNVFDEDGDRIPDRIDVIYPVVSVSRGDNRVGGRPVFLPRRSRGLRIDTNDGPTAMAVGAARPGGSVGTVDAGTVLASDAGGASLVFDLLTTVTLPAGEGEDLSLTEVPVDQLPIALPAGLAPAGAVAIQPEGGSFDLRPRIVLANDAGIPAGTPNVPLYRFDDATAAWIPLGTSTVSADGATIVSDAQQGPIGTGWCAVVLPTFCTTTVVGRVEDGLGVGVEDVLVTTVQGASAATNAMGDFTIPGVELPGSMGPLLVTALPEPNTGHRPVQSATSLAVCGGTTNVGTLVLADLAIDVTAPTVLSSVPANGATDVADNASLAVTFSEVMSPGSLNATNLVLASDGTTLPTAIGFSVGGGQTTATIQPLAPLPLASDCTLTVRSEVLDAAGNGLARDVVIAFQTVASFGGGMPSVAIQTPGPLKLDPGDSSPLSALALDATGTPVPGAGFTWSSDDPSVVSVDATGSVTAIAPGSTNVHAAFGMLSDSITVDVAVPMVATVNVTPSDQGLAAGAVVSLSAQALDALAAPLAGTSFTWTSSDPMVASAAADGTVSAVAGGMATITATETSSMVFGTALVTVTEPAAIASVAVNPQSPTTDVGQSVQLTATAFDGMPAVVPGVVFTWSSSEPTVAAVSANGVVTGVAPGTASITALANGTAVMGQATVNVLADTRLSVTVVGATEADDPVVGARVLRQDSVTGAFVEEATTSGSGIADFGPIGTTRTTFTVVHAATAPGEESVLHTLVDVPTGNYTVTDGVAPPVAMFDVQANGLTIEDSVQVHTPRYEHGEEVTGIGQPPSVTLLDIAPRHLQSDGRVSLVVLGSTISLPDPLSVAFLLDALPATLDQTQQSVTLSAGSLRTIPFTSDNPVRASGGRLRRKGLVFDFHWGPGMPSTTGTAVLPVPTGVDRVAVRLEDPPSSTLPTRQRRERVYDAVPTSVSVTMPDLTITELVRGTGPDGLSWTVIGTDASALDFASASYAYADGAGNPARWSLHTDPGSGGFVLPTLPSSLLNLVPPTASSFGVDLLAADGVGGFEAGLALLEPYLGNLSQFLLDTKTSTSGADRRIHSLEFVILGSGVVSVDVGFGPMTVTNGAVVEVEDGTFVTISATAMIGESVLSLMCPEGMPVGVGSPAAFCSYSAKRSGPVIVSMGLP